MLEVTDISDEPPLIDEHEITEANQAEEVAIEEGDAATGIIVHTIRIATGLKTPVVFVCNAVTEAFADRPIRRMGLQQLFVALMRASEELHVLRPEIRQRHGPRRQIGTDSVRLADLIVNAPAAIGVRVDSA